ncbi:ABC transporter ATP-binding protein [Rhodococcus erythropolis]|uniref:ABC transporter ATP-binding protein n=1 Tax=Rhodococcus erythropolis TaxID=1833 RepID=UPI003823E5D2
MSAASMGTPHTAPYVGAETAPNLLEIRGLAMGFGAAPDVLHGVDVTVKPGEFVTIIGPSGCGKSTVLNAVAGLLEPREGTVLFEGARVDRINTKIGYMTQGDTLLPWLTVYANVALPLKYRRISREIIEQKVNEVLTLLDLGAATKKFPSQLSGGMKRRALLARSMIYQPQLMLMDEPFAALDAQLRTQLHGELLRTTRLMNQAVLFITHDIYEAVLLSDKVLVLGGSPAQVVSTFEVPFVDRDVETLRFDSEFVALEREIHDALNAARGQK